MELELSLKITKVRDGLTELLFEKDRNGAPFFSRETDFKFILTAHLKGFAREKIKIEINEEGTQIVIRGEKQVEEMVMVGVRIHKKEVKERGFRKVFRIPDGVILDGIKAKFNEDEAILSIVMPKSIKGIRGVGIEEVKEDKVDRGGSKADEIPKQESFKMTNEQESKEPGIKDTEEIDHVGENLAKALENKSGKETEETKEGQQVEPLGQSEKTELPPPEKTQSEKLPDLEEKAKKEKISEAAESEKTKERSDEIQQSQVEEEDTKGKIPQIENKLPPQESPKEVEQGPEVGQSKKTEIPPPEKPQAEELSGLKDEIAEAESKKAEGRSEEHERNPETIESTEVPNKTLTQQSQVEEESPRGESETPQGESQKHQSKTDIQEPEKLKPDQELGWTATPRTDHSADQENKIEQEERQEAATDQVKLSAGKEVQNLESSKVEKQKGPSDQTNQTKKPSSETSKLCTTRYIVGSAFLVSLLVLVIHLIRAKKG